MPETTTNTGNIAGESEIAMSDISNIQRGCIPAGTVTVLGTVERSSLTAYLIGGTWVPFDRLHGRPAAVMPLVSLAW